MKKLLLMLPLLIIMSCNQSQDQVRDIHCGSNEILHVFSQQGTGLVILDHMYSVERDCRISREQQEANNDYHKPHIHCTWGY